MKKLKFKKLAKWKKLYSQISSLTEIKKDEKRLEAEISTRKETNVYIPTEKPGGISTDSYRSQKRQVRND